MKSRGRIVEEVRAARVALAAAVDYDLDRLAQGIKEREALGGREVVRLPPREVTVVVRKAS